MERSMSTRIQWMVALAIALIGSLAWAQPVPTTRPTTPGTGIAPGGAPSQPAPGGPNVPGAPAGPGGFGPGGFGPGGFGPGAPGTPGTPGAATRPAGGFNPALFGPGFGARGPAAPISEAAFKTQVTV